MRKLEEFVIEKLKVSANVKKLVPFEKMINFKEYIIEKLKVPAKNYNMFQIELGNFITWYMYDTPDWEVSDLKYVKFANDTVVKYFNGSYDKLYDFISKHFKDVIYVSEAEIDKDTYIYSFEIYSIPFKIQAHIENNSELLSNQKKLLVEKLKVSNNYTKLNIKSTLKRFFLWYCGYNDNDAIIDDFWNNMEQIEFDNDAIESNFRNKKEFLDWFEKHMNKIVYFDEVKVGKETYEYTFSCDGIEFVIDALVSLEDNNIYPFSQSQYVFKNVHEKLNVSNKNYDDELLIKLHDFVTWYMYTPNWDADYFKNTRFARNETQKYFNGSYKHLYDFIIKHEQEVIAVSEEQTETPSIYMYSFDVDGIPFNFEGYVRDDSYLLSKQYKLLL